MILDTSAFHRNCFKGTSYKQSIVLKLCMRSTQMPNLSRACVPPCASVHDCSQYPNVALVQMYETAQKRHVRHRTGIFGYESKFSSTKYQIVESLNLDSRTNLNISVSSRLASRFTMAHLSHALVRYILQKRTAPPACGMLQVTLRTHNASRLMGTTVTG